jgi:hypothetical protein
MGEGVYPVKAFEALDHHYKELVGFLPNEIAITHDEFRWAWSIIKSRAFNYSSSQYNELREQQTSRNSKKGKVLYPVLDLANHASSKKANAKLVYGR